VTPECLPAILAMTIEREDGLPCGCCGGRHVGTAQELNSEEHPCACWCCHGALADVIEADFPDLVTTSGGVRIITQAACEEAIRRMEKEIVSMEIELGECSAEPPSDR
jgi:hypothetical protein